MSQAPRVKVDTTEEGKTEKPLQGEERKQKMARASTERFLQKFAKEEVRLTTATPPMATPPTTTPHTATGHARSPQTHIQHHA